ncbi:MAG TPA: HlyD family efflux transporter periplasmic adaptor subunit [Planctomycetaceae bacterium]|nr:HlyD family efflux transporter periplasmic adaptor subunit [Planctomycetaceae bacterium]
MVSSMERDLDAGSASPPADRSSDQKPSSRPREVPAGVRKFAALGLVLLAILLIGGTIALFPGMVGYGSASDSSEASTQRVSRGRLLVTVTEDGNLESASNVEVRCQVAGGGTIIWIIPDGSMVEEGQELVRLDQSVIEDQLNTQKINYEKAVATKIQADEDFAAASIAVKEYDLGTYLKDVQSAESQIKIAMENLRSAENTLSHTERMFRKGFVTALQLDADKFSVERAKLDLDAAQIAKKVLQEFTRPKTLKGLQATRDAAEARTRSEQAALNLEKAKLDRLQNQLKFSVIKAPQRGMVIYANENSGRRGLFSSQSSNIEEGAVVRERQTLIRLPDLTKMQVKVTVHESKVDLIRPGMPARIKVQDRKWVGKVVSVANQPEPSSFFAASIKEYATTVSIEGDTTGLKPGMTAEVEILVDDLHDVLTVPVSAVVEKDGRFFAWVKDKTALHRRPLLLGQTNDKVMQITDGLKEKDDVILNPRAVVAEAQEGLPVSVEAEKADRFGKAAEPADANGAAGAKNSAPPAAVGAKAGVVADQPARREQGARPPGDAKSDGSRKTGEARRREGRNRPQLDFNQLDKNKDGKITVDELPEQMRGFFDRLDADHDGAISRKELDEARKKFGARRRQQGEGQQGGQGAPQE